ncbi:MULTISPECIES: ABC transporter ATP-binding protein [Chitinophagaceae]
MQLKKFNRLLKYIGMYKSKIFLYLILTLIGSFLSVGSIATLGPMMSIIFAPKGGDVPLGGNFSFFNNILQTAIVEHGQLYAVLLCCGFIILTTFLKNAFLYWSSVISVPVRSAITIHLKNDMYSKILTLPVGYFSDQRKGDIMARMSNDASIVEGSIINTMEGLIKDPVMVLVYLGAMISISPKLSLFLFVLLPLTAFVIGRISRSLKKQSSAASIRVGETLSILDETLGGIRVVKAFCAEKILRNKFINLNNTLLGITKNMSRRRDLASPLTELLGVTVLCIIIYFGANLIIKGDGLTGGDLLKYIAMFAMMINPAKSLSSSFFNVQQGAAAVDRIEELLSTPVTIPDEGTKKLENFSGEIEFRNVSFGYNDKTVLKNINLKIPRGKTVALVGSSGAGKSTLADLVTRFHDVTSGEILFDGVNIKDYSIESVRRKVGIVTQEPILFNDTIANNITLGNPDAPMDEITQAAKIANAYNFIENKPEKFETNIGDRGGKLSGGERQRVTIARAVLSNPPILILDEATSSLDTESERVVQDAINNMMQNRTSLVIAHRLSTIRNADEIIVLDHGEIKERGTHAQLIHIENGIYKKLVQMQGIQ